MRVRRSAAIRESTALAVLQPPGASRRVAAVSQRTIRSPVSGSSPAVTRIWYLVPWARMLPRRRGAGLASAAPMRKPYSRPWTGSWTEIIYGRQRAGQQESPGLLAWAFFCRDDRI
jgi:hypothetical protein